jgi:hypothetical protein
MERLPDRRIEVLIGSVGYREVLSISQRSNFTERDSHSQILW